MYVCVLGGVGVQLGTDSGRRRSGTLPSRRLQSLPALCVLPSAATAAFRCRRGQSGGESKDKIACRRQTKGARWGGGRRTGRAGFLERGSVSRAALLPFPARQPASRDHFAWCTRLLKALPERRKTLSLLMRVNAIHKIIRSYFADLFRARIVKPRRCSVFGRRSRESLA